MPRRQRDEARDWRATLFVWRGVLGGSETNCLTCDGVWEPTDAGALPDGSAYVDSKNDFALRTRMMGGDDLEILETCTIGPDMEHLGELFWGLEHLGDIKLTGSYQLDQGDGRGHQSYSDDWHDMAVSIRGPYAVVAACGETQFGRFISLGYVDGQDMMLARREGAGDDVRAAWRTPKDVLNGTDWGILEDGQESFDPEADGVLVAKLPWRVEPSKRGR